MYEDPGHGRLKILKLRASEITGKAFNPIKPQKIFEIFITILLVFFFAQKHSFKTSL